MIDQTPHPVSFFRAKAGVTCVQDLEREVQILEGYLCPLEVEGGRSSLLRGASGGPDFGWRTLTWVSGGCSLSGHELEARGGPSWEWEEEVSCRRFGAAWSGIGSGQQYAPEGR